MMEVIIVHENVCKGKCRARYEQESKDVGEFDFIYLIHRKLRDTVMA